MQCWQKLEKESLSLAALPGSLHTNDDTFNECHCSLATHSSTQQDTKTKHNLFFENNPNKERNAIIF